MILLREVLFQIFLLRKLALQRSQIIWIHTQMNSLCTWRTFLVFSSFLSAPIFKVYIISVGISKFCSILLSKVIVNLHLPFVCSTCVVYYKHVRLTILSCHNFWLDFLGFVQSFTCFKSSLPFLDTHSCG